MNRIFIIVLLHITLCLANAYAQLGAVWTKTYGNTGYDIGEAIVQLSDGGYLVAGSYTHPGGINSDFYLVRTDADGDSLWSRTYGTDAVDRCSALLETTDGGFVLAGYTYGLGSGGDFLLIRVDSEGDSLWSRNYGGSLFDRCYDMVELGDGSLVLVGGTRSFSSGSEDFWIIKVSSSGDSLWSNNFGGTLQDHCEAIERAPDGGFILGGSNESVSQSSSDMWLVKTDSLGNHEWDSILGGDGLDWGYDVTATPDGGYLLVGRSMSFGFHNYLAVKVDADGNELWSESYDNGGVEWPTNVISLSTGGYMISGFTSNSGAGGEDFWLVKINESGQVVVDGMVGGANDDEAWGIIENSEGDFIVTGFTKSFGWGEEEMWVVKVVDNSPNNPPGAFSRLLPEDGSIVAGTMIDLVWSRSVDLDVDEIRYVFDIQSPTFVTPFPNSGSFADTFITVTIIDPPQGTPTGTYEYFWNVRATDGIDTVDAVNGQGIFVYNYTAPNEPPDDFMRLEPFDCSIVPGSEFNLVWSTAADVNGDIVEYHYEVMTPTFVAPEPASGATTDTFATITIPTPPDTFLSSFYEYFWTVFATDGVDTTYALNGQGIFYYQYTAPNHPPGEFTRLTPADSSINEFNGSCAWSTSLDPDGNMVEYIFHIESDYPHPFGPIDTVLSDTTIDVEILIPDTPLDELFWFNWTVLATDGVDTIEAANGAGTFGLDIILASDNLNPVVNEFGLNVYPNPFNPSTTIHYTLDQTGPVSITVTDILGRQVAELVDATMNPGSYRIHWTAQSENGMMLPSGSYWVSLSLNQSTEVHRIILMH